MADIREAGESKNPYAGLINPVYLPQAEKDAYFQRYFEALSDEGGSVTPFYEGMRALDVLVRELGLGVGAMIRVYDDGAYDIDPHFVLTREGWKVVNKKEDETPDLEDLLRRQFVKWSLTEHAVIFDDKPPALT